jgi:hypothetical protein
VKRQGEGIVKVRRPLIEGIKPGGDVDPAAEREFVFGAKAKLDPSKHHPDPKPTAEAQEGKGPPASSIGRVPLTTRVRADYAAALKRASLERQLKGVEPYTLQDILEDALQPWLRANGYLI